MSQLFTWGGQSIGVSASASVLPMNTRDGSPLGWTGWILQSKGLSRVFSNTTVQKHQLFGLQLSSQSNSHIHTWLVEKPSRVNYSFFTRIWIGFLMNFGHFQHSCWPCGRKQHHMNICIYFLENLIDLILKPSAQYFICFTQNKHFDPFWKKIIV